MNALDLYCDSLPILMLQLFPCYDCANNAENINSHIFLFVGISLFHMLKKCFGFFIASIEKTFYLCLVGTTYAIIADIPVRVILFHIPVKC